MTEVDIDKTKKACKGDRNAFSELVQERRDDIYRLAYTYVKNSEDALEILHDTVYKALLSIKKLKNPEFLNTWLMRITINCCYDFLKKKGRISKNEIKCTEAEDMEKYADTVSEPSQRVANIDLFHAIDKLDINQKTVIILKYFQDFTIVQVAEILKWPVGTVKTRLNKALEALRCELEEVG